MDQLHASTQLQALAKNSTKKSKAARLRELMNDIDLALNSGVPRTEILETLAQSGLEMTMDYFDIARRRIKRTDQTRRNIGLITENVEASKNNMLISKTPGKEAPLTESDSIILAPEKKIDNNIVQNPPSEFNPSSIRRIRDQKVDLAALAKLATKGKT